MCQVFVVNWTIEFVTQWKKGRNGKERAQQKDQAYIVALMIRAKREKTICPDRRYRAMRASQFTYCCCCCCCCLSIRNSFPLRLFQWEQNAFISIDLVFHIFAIHDHVWLFHINFYSLSSTNSVSNRSK